ncbi:hypothetical protein, partial [Achromobacter xylosoxidans]
MAVPVTVTFYRIQRCGHYKGHNKEPALGGVTRTLQDIARWASGLRLEQTKTYTPIEGGTLPVYLADVGQSGTTWLITLWNETHGVDEEVPSLMANAGVGQAAVILNKAKAGSIPGFATYFWFIPDLGVFATLRFVRPFTGQTGLQNYISSFLEHFSSFCVRETDEEGEIKVVGYREGIIDEWEKSGGADSGADFGFFMRGDHKEYWLAKSLARDQFALDLDGA